MIELAGISVRDQTPELQAMLDGIWTPDYDAHRQPRCNYNTLYHLPIGDDRVRPPKLGVLRWPCDVTRWATMYLMVSDQELRDIIKESNNRYGTYGNYTDIKIDDGTNSITAYYMKILPARPITQTPRKWDDPYPSKAANDLWLLPLVDKRYDWLAASAGGISGGAVQGVGTVTGTPTWENYIYNYLSTITNYVITPTVDTIPSIYPVPGNPVRNDQVDYWLGNTIRMFPTMQFVQAMIDHTGGGFSLALDENMRIWRPLNAKAVQKAAYDANINNIISGGLIDVARIADSLPGYCAVYTNNTALNNGTSGIMRAAFITMNSSVTGILPGAPDGTADITDAGSSTGDLSANATIYSDFPLAGRTFTDFKPVAVQLAKDWYNWRFASRVDATFRGIINWPLSAADWCVEWSSGCYGTQPTTRVYPLPLYNWDRYGAPQNKDVVRTAIIGSKGGNVALTNLIAFLKTYGYIDDLTT